MRRGIIVASAAAVTVLAATTMVLVLNTGRDSSTGAAPSARRVAQGSTTASVAVPQRSSTTGLGAIEGGPSGPAHPAAAPSVSAEPVRLLIPSIGVDTSLQHLGLDSDGALQSPAKWQVAGWYAGGVRPGDVGPAVIAGHIDSVSGPAVFSELRTLSAGAVVSVVRSDASTVRFVVASVAAYPKTRFPTSAVYSPTAVPVLRLVTCGGAFDSAARSYVDNIVVTAYRQ